MSTDTADVTSAAPPIRNPVLPGFYPDPSILRVANDYYLATSTFEWYPGVTVHHSRDLVHWRPLGGILTETRLLDLRGAADSAGVWAPDLTHVDGQFHLVYTDVSSFGSGYWDSQNYLITAPHITGPWSDPVPLHARGFDASLFHDHDGSTWMLWMNADWRLGHNPFGGIGIQRYDRTTRQLVGQPTTIYTGTEAGYTEGPHLYHKDGWYYLLTAEGGTSWQHQVTVARSRSLLGPYQTAPHGPLLTSAGHPELPLQKAGHGSLVTTQHGDWYLAHLVARPYGPLGNCVLGRETAIQPVTWHPNDWPHITGHIPAEHVDPPNLPNHPWPDTPDTDHFDQPQLSPQWATLRRPATPDWVNLTDRPSHLRIHGGQSPVGRQRPSLVARRVTSPHCQLETIIEFHPTNHRQLAGITGYYNTVNWHHAYLTTTDDGQLTIEVQSCDRGQRRAYPEATTTITGTNRLALQATFNGPTLHFAYNTGTGWHQLPVELDATILSDEHVAHIVPGEPEAWGFTGAFIGLWVQDLGNDGAYADFDQATYRET